MSLQSPRNSPQPARQGAVRTPSFPQPSSAVASSASASSARDGGGPKPPLRAHTFHNGSSPQPARRDSGLGPDAFDTSEAPDHEDNAEPPRTSVDLDDLPIELVTLTDSFIESLGAKVHPTPPNMERLSQLFQEFYALASSHIATHIGALATRQSRDASPAPSVSSISSAASRLRSKATSLGAKDKPRVEPERQMITVEELANRKRARRALEAKRGLLEEAAERRLCEGIYGRIYRHRSTQDEAQDDKLRSKTAALALVGIGPADLGINIGGEAPQTQDAEKQQAKEVRESLAQARQDLSRMADSRYPLGKLNHLKAAHRSIVDTLACFHPSASADEVMPMLIYTLITLPPENLHIISDLHFVQNFRWEPKLTGEAAYCLTNLEAAISFLQTVDLATLRADEHPSGPPKSPARPGTLRVETFPPAYPQGLTPSTASANEPSPDGTSAANPAPSTASGLKATDATRNRRLSDLVNTPAQALGAASDAVISTADQGLKTISSSLGDSYSFLLGKFRERQQGPKESSIAVPRTLDDARKLVSTPPPDEEDNASTAGSPTGGEDAELQKPSSAREDRVLSMIGGRRDASADSSRSANPSKRAPLAEEQKAASPSPNPPGQNPAVLEQMRSLGSTLNPMARLSNIGGFRGFGRNVSTLAPKDVGKSADGGDLASAFPDIAAALPPKQVTRMAPPNRRFMELQNPGELRIGEVLELLRDYRRLAGALKSMDAFEEK